MTLPMASPAPVVSPVVPPHAGSGPLTAAQLRLARVRIALEQLTTVLEDLDDCPVAGRQAACTGLAALVELQAVLRTQARAASP